MNSMREIKFRVFIKTLEWILPVERICFDCNTIEVDLTDGNGDTAEYDFDEVEIMQYTGLKDITGREVYEGDVIQHHLGTELGQVKYGAYRSCHDTLKTEHWGFYVDFKQEYMRKDIGYWFGIINIAVIGNIYENPELLEVNYE